MSEIELVSCPFGVEADDKINMVLRKGHLDKENSTITANVARKQIQQSIVR